MWARRKNNKTLGYLRDILRPPTLLKMTFRKMNAFFFQNTLLLHHIFQHFQLWKFYTFAKKTPKTKVERHSQEIIPFETLSREHLPHACNGFEKLQSFLSHLFLQKNPKLKWFENSYFSYRILVQICYDLVKRNFHVQKRDRKSF